MARKKLPRPTDAELEILKVLWTQGPSTVRDVYDAINSKRPTGYTSVLKLMQLMTEKGMLLRDESNRAHVYEAGLAQDSTENQLIGDLLERVFDGSALKLFLGALNSKRASKAELTEIRKMLDEFERGEKK